MISASFCNNSTKALVSNCSSFSALLFFQRRLSFSPLEVCIDSMSAFIFSTQRLLAWIFARIFLLMVLARISSNSSLSLSFKIFARASASSQSFSSSSLNFTAVPLYFAEISIRFTLMSRKELSSSSSPKREDRVI